MHKGAKFTDKQIEEIRALYSPCACCGHRPSYASIGKIYGVSAVSIFHIIKGLWYKRTGK